MTVQIKVCGVGSLADAEKALELGADMLGFNFYAPSPRYIEPESAHAILRELPSDGAYVALFVNAPRPTIEDVLARNTGLPKGSATFGWLQFHGDEDADFCRDWRAKVIKAVRMKTRDSLAVMESFPADLFLLDSWSSGYGGSGRAFPWEWLEGKNASKLMLSGGLNVDNVAEAVRRVRPFAVDVCSGVESRPGKKDYGKLKEFILAAKGA
jgi:phosphoribosylanthranilate isomerase